MGGQNAEDLRGKELRTHHDPDPRPDHSFLPGCARSFTLSGCGRLQQGLNLPELWHADLGCDNYLRTLHLHTYFASELVGRGGQGPRAHEIRRQ